MAASRSVSLINGNIRLCRPHARQHGRGETAARRLPTADGAAMSHEKFMRRAQALALAKMRANDGGPFGAVIVRGGDIIAEGWNQETTANDPTAHAEIV